MITSLEHISNNTGFSDNKKVPPSSKARYLAIKYLYYLKAHSIHFYSHIHFNTFLYQNPQTSSLSKSTKSKAKSLIKHTLNDLAKIDRLLTQHTNNWKVERFFTVDREILRLATNELLNTKTNHKIVINEAIILAKIFGDKNSTEFINGILDSIAKSLLSADDPM